MTPDERRLLAVYERLPDAARAQLLDFAEFLAARHGPRAMEAPKDIPRPEKETVIAAVKRLSATYHMVERDKVLHETSALVSAHLLQGRPAADVIDELERIFRRHYERLGGGQS
ncbi:MAG: Crp/Fnr family transcriptional regulator [Thiohalomonadaceae bacterium]